MSNSPPVEKQDALEFAKLIEKVCEEKGIWISTQKSKEPNLKNIVLTISIRIK